jgi:hypothetical protein
VEWGTPIQDPSNGVDIYPYARFVGLDVDVDPQEKSLANLAYGSHADPLAAFQADYPSDTSEDVNKDGTPCPRAKPSA